MTTEQAEEVGIKFHEYEFFGFKFGRWYPFGDGPVGGYVQRSEDGKIRIHCSMQGDFTKSQAEKLATAIIMAAANDRRDA